MALCTRKQVRQYLQHTGSDPNVDTVIDGLCDTVSTLADKYCGRTLELATHTEYYNGFDSQILYTDNYPIVTISGVWEDTGRVWASTSEVPSSYYFNDDISIIRSVGYWMFYPHSIKLVYTAGYSTIPADLNQAAIMEVAYIYNKHKDGMNVLSRTVGETITTYSITELQSDTKMILDRYKRHSLV